jgi:hypothetical protein
VSGTRCTRESDEDEKWKEGTQVFHACEMFFTVRRDDTCCCDAGTQVIHLRERFFLSSCIFNWLAALWKVFFFCTECHCLVLKIMVGRNFHATVQMREDFSVPNFFRLESVEFVHEV